jgi:hypothetical protein
MQDQPGSSGFLLQGGQDRRAPLRMVGRQPYLPRVESYVLGRWSSLPNIVVEVGFLLALDMPGCGTM